MPAYKRNSHFKELYIRKIAGSAIVADLAVVLGGAWNLTELELLIDGNPYGDNTGKYQHISDGRLPYDISCIRIQARLLKILEYDHDVLKWKLMPLWRLLYRVSPSFIHIQTALVSIQSEIKNYIWKNPLEEVDINNPFSMQPITLENIEAIATFNNFEALLTLTAWARATQNARKYEMHYHCAKLIRKIFAHVVCNTPQLFIRWPILLQYYIEPIWFVDELSARQLLNINQLESEIYQEECKAREIGIQLPSKYFFNQINKKDIYLLRDTFKH